MGKSSDGAPPLRMGSWINLFLLLLLVTIIEETKADALISSWLLNCSGRQTNKIQEDIDCLKKLSLKLSVVSGKSGGSDTIETFVTSVRGYGGVSSDLEEPYRITIYKSDIYAQYPLEYIQSFNEFPHEVELFAASCKDDDNERTPNCGWLYDKAGEKVQDSQGFCCFCSLRDKLPRWLGGETSSRRSKQDCNSTLRTCLNLLPWRRRGSAHCLRLSTQWYPTFQIGSPNQTFTVKVVGHMVHSSRDASSITNTYFDYVDLSPHRKAYINSKRTMRAKLQAHGILPNELSPLTGRYLSIPYKEGKCDISANTNKWLALPKEFYTLDGTDCDKIGVSYHAFRVQVQPCARLFQSCCNNQLKNFAEEESKRSENGQKPLYVVSRFGDVFATHQTEECPLQMNLSTVQVNSARPRNILSSFAFNLSETDDITRFMTCKIFLQDNMGDKTDVFEVKFDYPSREEFAGLMRATAPAPSAAANFSFTDWFRGLFNFSRWFSFNTSFSFCWFWCANNTAEFPQGTNPAAANKPTSEPSSLWNVFSWTPCGDCTNIILHFKCYVTSLCWTELLKFVALLLILTLGIYTLWMMHRQGTLMPIVKMTLRKIGECCDYICNCLTKLFDKIGVPGGHGGHAKHGRQRKKKKRKRQMGKKRKKKGWF